MGRMPVLDRDARRAAKERLYASLEAGQLDLGEAIRLMRHIAGLTQAEYATRIAKVSPATLAQIEQGRANPTVETLDRIGRGFGLRVGFVRIPRE